MAGDGLAVAGRDQDGLGAGGDHVLHRRHLAGVVAVGLAGAGQQLGALGLGGLGGAFLHLHEEGVGLGLGDQADDGLAHRQGVADCHVDAAQLAQACAALPALELVCSGCLALAPDDAPTYLPWLRAQRALGRTVVVDANLRPSVMPDLPAYRRNVLAALQLADIIKASDEDLVHLGAPGEDAVEQAVRLLQATSAQYFALTLGPKGACLIDRNGAVWHATESAPVEVVDAVGAGDCFLAGLLVAWLRLPAQARAAGGQLGDRQAQDLLAHALASATLCVMRRGAVPPTAQEVQQHVAQLPAHIERLRASGGLRANSA
jgi:fructokinase